MDPTPAVTGVVDAYLNQGVLGITIVGLAIFCGFLMWRNMKLQASFDAYRAASEQKVQEVTERRLADQQRAMDAMSVSVRATDMFGVRIDALTEALRTGR